MGNSGDGEMALMQGDGSDGEMLLMGEMVVTVMIVAMGDCGDGHDRVLVVMEMMIKRQIMVRRRMMM